MVKRNSRDNGTSTGPRSAETDSRLAEYQAQRSKIQEAVASTERLLAENVAVFRSLKMPQAMPKPGRILRELDLAGLLGTDVMAVGTNAFAVYQIEATARFLNVADETEDFDLAWCRDSGCEPGAARRKAPETDGGPPADRQVISYQSTQTLPGAGFGRLPSRASRGAVIVSHETGWRRFFANGDFPGAGMAAAGTARASRDRCERRQTSTDIRPRSALDGAAQNMAFEKARPQCHQPGAAHDFDSPKIHDEVGRCAGPYLFFPECEPCLPRLPEGATLLEIAQDLF